MLEQSYFTPPVEYTAKEANELEVLTGFENSVLAAVEQTWWSTLLHQVGFAIRLSSNSNERR